MEYTQSDGVRPFGVSLLICSWNEGWPYLFQSDPSGAYFVWKATAMGKNYVNGKTFLEKRYNEDLELEDLELEEIVRSKQEARAHSQNLVILKDAETVKIVENQQ
jgi:20S proteasome subunit alpha 2